MFLIHPGMVVYNEKPVFLILTCSNCKFWVIFREFLNKDLEKPVVGFFSENTLHGTNKMGQVLVFKLIS